MVKRHIHKLVQVLGETIQITTEYLTYEEKAVVAGSKVEALEVERSKLRKELISAMDEGNATKEKVKASTEELRAEKLLTLTEEYKTVMFSWYYKGFKLLKRYLMKHNPEVDLESQDFELVDKEMEVNKAAQATAAATVVKENVAEIEGDASGPTGGSDAPVA
ncbi:hypothetical protein SO802_017705 [Lithocarpus litseifolius]|uniref:Uncharacterized protein n=1 Tax=Lithocarpus litseifolius TaxID=425828 RepID=A0AAW2CL43_9ROSI